MRLVAHFLLVPENKHEKKGDHQGIGGKDEPSMAPAFYLRRRAVEIHKTVHDRLRRKRADSSPETTEILKKSNATP